jgi:hypothetical protein
VEWVLAHLHRRIGTLPNERDRLQVNIDEGDGAAEHYRAEAQEVADQDNPALFSALVRRCEQQPAARFALCGFAGCGGG